MTHRRRRRHVVGRQPESQRQGEGNYRVSPTSSLACVPRLYRVFFGSAVNAACPRFHVVTPHLFLSLRLLASFSSPSFFCSFLSSEFRGVSRLGLVDLAT